MRCFNVIILVALLEISMIGIGSSSVSAQDTPEVTIEDCVARTSPEPDIYVPWQGVCRPIPLKATVPVPPDNSQLFQPYAVRFVEEFAATREMRNTDDPAEFMVVFVREGTFALDLAADGSGRVLVSSLHDAIPTLTEYNPGVSEYYEVDDSLKNADGSICLRACPVDPGMRVKLQEGDIALAQAGTICIWCLLNGGELGIDDEFGQLDVFILQEDPTDPIDTEDFSWIRDWVTPSARTSDSSQETLEAEVPAIDSRVALGWALFNPSSNCRGN